MRSICIALLFLSCTLAFPEKPECTHGEPQVIDWTRMTKKFYLTYYAGNLLADMAVCHVSYGFSEHGDRLDWLIDDYQLMNGSLSKGQNTNHFIRHTNGGYSFTRENVDMVNNELDNEESCERVKEDLDHLVTHEIFIFTDYENYRLSKMCTADGSRILFVYFTRRQPTDADLKIVQDKLEEIGEGWEKVTLEKTRCSEIESYPGYEEYAEDFKAEQEEAKEHEEEEEPK